MRLTGARAPRASPRCRPARPARGRAPGALASLHDPQQPRDVRRHAVATPPPPALGAADAARAAASPAPSPMPPRERPGGSPGGSAASLDLHDLVSGGAYWDLLTHPDADGAISRRAKSASDASLLRRKGHLKEQVGGPMGAPA
jgi:hypothetical protein